MRADAPVVLGAGIAGLSMAWELARAGAAPLVVRGSRPRTSEAAAGMLAPGPELAINPALGRLAVEGLRHYPAFLEELAAASAVDPGYSRGGVLRLAYAAEEVEQLREQGGSYEAAGFATRWLSARACLEAEPGLGATGLQGGLLSYDEAQVLPSGLLAALAEAVAERGGRFLDADVSGLVPAAGSVRVELAGAEAVEADQVVVALGSWTGLLEGAGELGRLVQPVKGQLLVFERGPGPAPVLYWGHNYLLTKADGTVLLGGTMEPDRGYADAPDERVEALREVLDRVWPALTAAPATARSGLRPRAPDALPLIGRLPGAPGVYLFTAHFRNGFLLAPVTARLAASEILGGAAQPLLERLRPARLTA